MAEPDHIFVNPLPNLAHGGLPAGFPFFYIKPTQNEKIIRKFFPKENGPVTNVDPIGNSPVIIKKVKSIVTIYLVNSWFDSVLSNRSLISEVHHHFMLMS